MRYRYFCFLIIAFAVFACNRQDGPAESTAQYKIGYMICNSREETIERFIPLTEYLSQQLGVRFEAVAIDTINFVNQVEDLDFTHTNSLLYIIMNRFHGVSPIAAEKNGSLGGRSKGVIAALKKSNINTLADLQGKSMIFGPMLAPTGFMSQIDLLQRQGVDPEKDLSFYTIPRGSFKHEKVIYGVMFEKYDAGAFPFYDFEKMTIDGRIDPEDFTILGEGYEIPYCNFAVTPRVDDSFAAKFKKVLLAINEQTTVAVNGEVVNIFKLAQIDGYEAIADEDYDVVREMAKRTNMPPYQQY